VDTAEGPRIWTFKRYRCLGSWRCGYLGVSQNNTAVVSRNFLVSEKDFAEFCSQDARTAKQQDVCAMLSVVKKKKRKAAVKL
jgi:hypothetical protein